MIIEKNRLPFGKIVGKLKLNREEAERMFNFTPKKGAIGVSLYVDKKGRQLIRSIMKRKDKSKFIIDWRKKFKIVTKIAKKILNYEVIKKCWEEKNLSCHNAFMKENLKRIKKYKKFEKLIITKGNLTLKRQNIKIKIKKNGIEIENKLGKNNEIFCLFINTYNFKTKLAKFKVKKRIKIKRKIGKNTYAFLFIKRNNDVSNSIPLITELRRKKWLNIMAHLSE